MTNGTLGAIAAFAKGMPVKIISAEATGAPDAFWYARPESGIKLSRIRLERPSRSPHLAPRPISSSYSSSTRRR
jgi:hypothetical protein